MTSHLAVSGLTKRFPARRTLADMLRREPRRAVHAVEQVTLDIRKGETLGIVGESGCGKSTLARCLVRLYEPDAGSITFDGADVIGLAGDARRQFNRRVQMVFQDPYGSLNPRMTVGATLAEALRVHAIVPPAEVSARVRALLDLVHLPADAAERYPHEFSGGQRQRIGIARALAVEPSLLIADEPVSALDVSVQAAIVNLFMELQERLGLTLVFITHDLRLVKHITHRVAVMYLGKIVELAEKRALFSAPKHPYTEALLSAVPLPDPAAKRERIILSGDVPSPIRPPAGCRFHTRCPHAFDRCRAEEPPLKAVAPGHLAACHLHDAAAVAATPAAA